MCLSFDSRPGRSSPPSQLSVRSTCERVLAINYSDVWEDGRRRPEAMKENAGRYVGDGGANGKKREENKTKEHNAALRVWQRSRQASDAFKSEVT